MNVFRDDNELKEPDPIYRHFLRSVWVPLIFGIIVTVFKWMAQQSGTASITDAFILFCVSYSFAQLLSLKLQNDSIGDRIEKSENNLKIYFDKSQAELHGLKENIHELQTVKKYLSSLNNVHKLAITSLPADKSLEILSNATVELQNVFKSSENSKGFSLPNQTVIILYEYLSKGVKNIVIVEPEIPDQNIDKIYDGEYLRFLQTISTKSKGKDYIYIVPAKNPPRNAVYNTEVDNIIVANCTFLNNNGFSIKKLLLESNFASPDIMQWADYSHLIFEYEDNVIACSVMPLYSAKETKELSKQLLNQYDNPEASTNFKLAVNVFLIVTQLKNIPEAGDTGLSIFLNKFNKLKINSLNISDIEFPKL